jgi:hypothetical protein
MSPERCNATQPQVAHQHYTTELPKRIAKKNCQKELPKRIAKKNCQKELPKRIALWHAGMIQIILLGRALSKHIAPLTKTGTGEGRLGAQTSTIP